MSREAISSIDDYIYLSIISESNCGYIVKARHRVTQTVYAIKIMALDLIIHSDVDYKEEIRTQTMLDHPNIVKIYTTFIDVWNNQLRLEYVRKGVKCVFIVLEYANYGNLFAWYSLHKCGIEDNILRGLTKQLIDVIEYIHSHEISHRDLKMENMLVVGFTANMVPIIKLCDFGFATTVFLNNKKMGTCEYMAPEIVNRCDYTNKVDLWSLGIILYELCVGNGPFFDKDIDRLSYFSWVQMIEKRICDHDISFDNISNIKIRELVTSLLSRDACKRTLSSYNKE